MLEKLKPAVVVRPWTEHPKAAANAKIAPSVYSLTALSRLEGISAAQQFAERFLKGAGSVLPGASKLTLKRITFMAEQSIRNKVAIERLERMSKGKKATYVHAGTESGLERVLPGIRISVLGPPTLAQ